MVEAKELGVNIKTTEIWNYCSSIALQNVLSAHDCIKIWNMSKNMAMEIVKNRKISQLQVGYMSYPDLNQNKVFKDQVERSISLTFEKIFPYKYC